MAHTVPWAMMRAKLATQVQWESTLGIPRAVPETKMHGRRENDSSAIYVYTGSSEVHRTAPHMAAISRIFHT